VYNPSMYAYVDGSGSPSPTIGESLIDRALHRSIMPANTFSRQYPSALQRLQEKQPFTTIEPRKGNRMSPIHDIPIRSYVDVNLRLP
jgi:hypothetical protein